MLKGLVAGLDKGIVASGTYANFKPKMFYCDADPMNFGNDTIISLTGSDLCYNIATGSFMIGDITNGIGGSVWASLQTI